MSLSHTSGYARAMLRLRFVPLAVALAACGGRVETPTIADPAPVPSTSADLPPPEPFPGGPTPAPAPAPPSGSSTVAPELVAETCATALSRSARATTRTPEELVAALDGYLVACDGQRSVRAFDGDVDPSVVGLRFRRVGVIFPLYVGPSGYVAKECRDCTIARFGATSGDRIVVSQNAGQASFTVTFSPAKEIVYFATKDDVYAFVRVPQP